MGIESIEQFLKTSREDVGFHGSRNMFWIIGGDIEIAPLGTTMSHLEMAEEKGWICDSGGIVDFFSNNVRGFYLKGDGGDRIHFYKGVDFSFDEGMMSVVLKILPKMKDLLDLNGETGVYFGPKDSVIKGVNYDIRFIGKIKNLLE